MGDDLRGSLEYQQGRAAADAGDSRLPYLDSTDQARAWTLGYQERSMQRDQAESARLLTPRNGASELPAAMKAACGHWISPSRGTRFRIAEKSPGHYVGEVVTLCPTCARDVIGPQP